MNQYILFMMRSLRTGRKSSFLMLSFLLGLFLLLSYGPAFGMGLSFGGTTTTTPPFSANYSSLISIGGSPTRIAVDSKGVLYVSQPSSKSILKFYQDGSSAGSIAGFKNSAGVMGLFQTPLSVAVDSSGYVYVGDSMSGKVSVGTADGRLVGVLGRGNREFVMPNDIAIASNGWIYVTDSKSNIVKVYSPDGSGNYPLKFSFGSPNDVKSSVQGQFNFPTGICSDDVNQEIYVVDQFNFRVEVFDRNGNFKRTFGGFTYGQGIYVANGKVFVADSYQDDVAVFDTAGSSVGYVGGYDNTTPGSLFGPYDVIIVGGTLFVANYGYGQIVEFSILDPKGLSISPLTLTFTADAGVNPSGQAVQVNPKVSGNTPSWTAAASGPFTINLDSLSGNAPASVTASVDVTGLNPGSYTGVVTFQDASGNSYPVTVNLTVKQPQIQLTVSPTTPIALTYEGGVLTSQALSVSSTGGSVSWTAAGNAPWLTVTPVSGANTPNSVMVGLNQTEVNKLADGTYNASVTITAPNATGSPATIPVTLTVVRQKLLSSPGSIDLFHQVNGDLENTSLSVLSSEGTLQWTGSSDAAWLNLSPVPITGITPSVITVALNQGADTLAEGNYTADITLNATNAVNSPVNVPVTLRVVVGGTIIVNILNTDLSSASFTVTGTLSDGSTVTYKETGKTWRTDEAKPGSYAIQFDYIKGYRRPASKKFDIETGKSVTIDAQYKPLPVANVIAAAEGPGPMNPATVRLLDLLNLSGKPISEFQAFTTMYGAEVAMGDIDGDGSDEIIAAPGPGPKNQAYVEVFRYDGSLVASSLPVPKTLFGANIAVGDIDGNGKAEIAMSIVDSSGSKTVIVYAFDGSQLIEKLRVPVTGVRSAAITYPASIAFADTTGDGWLKLVVANMGNISVYAFDSTMSSASVIASVTTKAPPADLMHQWHISAGDLNGDGVDEILIGSVDAQIPQDSVVLELKEDLSNSPGALLVKAFDKGKSSPSLSSMDVNGDGLCEFLAGAGALPTNDPILKIFDSGGNQLNQVKAFDASKYGVNAAFGVKK